MLRAPATHMSSPVDENRRDCGPFDASPEFVDSLCPLCGLASVEPAAQQRCADRNSAGRSEAESGQALDCCPKPALAQCGAARGVQSKARTEKPPKDAMVLKEEQYKWSRIQEHHARKLSDIPFPRQTENCSALNDLPYSICILVCVID